MHTGTADRAQRTTSGAGRAAPDHRRPDHWPPVTTAASLRPPPATFPVVPRQAAVARLVAATTRQVTLVCAPAGAGKTVLAGAWAATAPDVTGLGLAREDARPGVFWYHLVEALSVPDLTDRPRGPYDGAGATLDALALALEREDRRTTVVLDAFEEVTDGAALADLDRLLTLAGDRLRVVLLTRARPALPRHRYRLEGRLAELGPDDLRLDEDAVASLLDQHALGPSPDVVRLLTQSTEGWAAGVRLAALALQDQGAAPPSAEQALACLAPVDTLLGDYLRAEVVGPLPDDDRTRLRRLSLVDGFGTELATVLTGRPEDAGSLADLANRVPFLQRETPTSAQFRVHPLLRSVLHASYAAERPDEVRDLHRRAADWLAGAGHPVDAVDQQVRAGDLSEAVRVVAESGALAEVLLPTAPGVRLARLLAGVTDDVDTTQATLVAAAVSLASGDVEAAGARLAATPEGTWGPAAPSAELVRAALAAARGDAAVTLDATAAARDLLAMADAPPSEATYALLRVLEASARLASGDLDAAADLLGDALPHLPDDGVVGPRLDCLGRLALVEACRGHLARALELAGTAEKVAAGGDDTVHPPVAGHLARAWVATERQELSRALHWLGKAARLDDPSADPMLGSVSVLIRARLMRDRGEMSMARRLLADEPPGMGWVRAERELERFGLGLPGPETPASDEAGRRGVVRSLSARVELMLLEAEQRCLRTGGEPGRALVLEALALAEVERIRRPFAHAGPAVHALMRTDAQVAARAGWLTPADAVDQASPSTSPDVVTEVDLTERELEVLRHLAEMLSTQEIGSAMFISVNTVRTHVRHILHKLSVTRRNEAVRRARVLQLI